VSFTRRLSVIPLFYLPQPVLSQFQLFVSFLYLFLKVTSTASQSVVERWKKANARNAVAEELVAIIISHEQSAS